MLWWRPRHRNPDSARLSTCRSTAPIALAALAAAAIGCGDGDKVTAGPEALVPSKRDFVTRADGLCALYQGRIEQAGTDEFGLSADDVRVLPSGEIRFKAGRRPSDAKVSAFVTATVVPELRELTGELRTLTPPAGDASELQRVYDSSEAAIARIAGEPLLFVQSSRFAAIARRPDRLARGYGLKVCGIREAAP